METTTIFDNMPEAYRLDVENKIAELAPKAAEIHAHLVSMCKGQPGYMISTEFRLKSKIRIVEKDLKDYDGSVYPECLRSQVKDMFAARLCPPLASSHLYGTDYEKDVKLSKSDIRTKLSDYFSNYLGYKFTLTTKRLTIAGRDRC